MKLWVVACGLLVLAFIACAADASQSLEPASPSGSGQSGSSPSLSSRFDSLKNKIVSKAKGAYNAVANALKGLFSFSKDKDKLKGAFQNLGSLQKKVDPASVKTHDDQVKATETATDSAAPGIVQSFWKALQAAAGQPAPNAAAAEANRLKKLQEVTKNVLDNLGKGKKPSCFDPGAQCGDAPKPKTGSKATAVALLETELTEGVAIPPPEQFHLVVRAFIPGAGTDAASGYDSDDMTIGPASSFPGYRLPATAGHSYAGYAVGIYELDEIFNTNHRDWEYTMAANDRSKTFVHLKFTKSGSRYTHTLSNGSERTEHYCNGIFASFLQFWPTGLCCNHKANWGANEGASNFDLNSLTKLKFKVHVKKGNPCVPGSSVVGPIEHDLNFVVDFSTGKMSYKGTKSQFPALEVCQGTNPNNLRCHQFGVSGRDFWDLTFPDHKVEESMDIYVA